MNDKRFRAASLAMRGRIDLTLRAQGGERLAPLLDVIQRRECRNLAIDCDMSERNVAEVLTKIKPTESLDLSMTSATDANLTAIASLPIAHLKLGRHATDETLERLAALSKLDSLALRDSRITARGLSKLAHSRNLRFLTLSGEFILDDAAADSLLDVETLIGLFAESVPATDAALDRLAGHAMLSVLRLGPGPWTFAELAKFEKAPRIQKIVVPRGRLSAEELAIAADWKFKLRAAGRDGGAGPYRRCRAEGRPLCPRVHLCRQPASHVLPVWR